jgi:hypothetical protein
MSFFIKAKINNAGEVSPSIIEHKFLNRNSFLQSKPPNG